MRLVIIIVFQSSLTVDQVTDNSKIIHQVFKSVKDDAARIQLITVHMDAQARVIEKMTGDIRQLQGNIEKLQGNIEKLQEEKVIHKFGTFSPLTAFFKGMNIKGESHEIIISFKSSKGLRRQTPCDFFCK